jgi:RNA-binding protein 8A
LFADYGNIKSLHVNLDRKTGFLKGYAFIEFENLVDAQKSVNKLNGSNFLDKKINVGFAFKKPERKGVKK